MESLFYSVGGHNSLGPEVGRTNSVLDSEQALRVGAHLADAQRELQQWDDDLALLLARRARVADRVHRCNVALAPYKKLPVEITSQIMLNVVGVPASFPLSVGAALDPRLQLTQVCADWRQIAFHTPELWKIRFSRIPETSSASELASAWWSQCSGSHFSLVMDASYLHNPDALFDGISCDHFLFEHIISPHSARLVELQLAIRPETARKLLDLPAGSFHALETLFIRVDDGYGFRATRLDDGLNTAFSLSPHLSNVTLFARSIADPSSMRIPWSQLKELKLYRPPIPADLLLSLLSECSSLSTCVINSIDDIDANMANRIFTTYRVPLRLPELTLFRVDFAGSANHNHFLRALSLPKLSTLRIFCHSTVDPSNYIDILQGVGSTLEKFQISDVEPRPILWTEDTTRFQLEKALLSCAPHLLAFTAPENHFIRPGVLTEIASGKLLPVIQKLGFSARDLEPVLDMLETRLSQNGQEGVSVIREVLLGCPEPDSRLQGRLEDLAKNGVTVKIKPFRSFNNL
ncbi:hypothetical protein BDZ94DRAFT_612974 [Collybia nuda]|uniref:F-box domain-containing protein n=1 Tax=Collybia nuda TaxID=64659 RepID=A0A9P5Y728_9AGAR|nr:hypothetical protein BDZ94DRAFT_612974 [Collybia nuda]